MRIRLTLQPNEQMLQQIILESYEKAAEDSVQEEPLEADMAIE